MKRNHAIAKVLTFFAAAIVAACPMLIARAQNPADLMPDASAAKAKGILEQAITALGGPAYLNARDLDCKGRYGTFESATGASDGSVEARFMRQLPDKARNEMDAKTFITDIYGIPVNTHGRVVMVYTSDGAWSLGKGEVTDMGADAVSGYKEQLQTDMNMILRYRMNEDGLVLRYSGSDIVDLKQVEWVEIGDRARHNIRVAVDTKTHLPVRADVFTRDSVTGLRVDTARAYSNYRNIDGVQVPFQTSVLINDRPSGQIFYSSCQTNAGLSPALFTRSGLESEASKTGKKQK